MAVSKVPASSPSPQLPERSCGPMASLVDYVIARDSVPVSNTPPEDARLRRAAAINATLRKYLTEIPIKKAAEEKERVRQPRAPLNRVVRREPKFIPPAKEPKYWIETLDCGHRITEFEVFSRDFDGHTSNRAPTSRFRRCEKCEEARQKKSDAKKRAKKKKR